MPQPHTGELQPSGKQLWTFDSLGNLFLTGQVWTEAVPDPTQPGPGQALSGGFPVTGLTPSGDTSGVTDTAMIQALLNRGPGMVPLGQGTFYVTSLTAVSQPQYLVGRGEDLTVIMAVGTGDCIRMFNPVRPAHGFADITAWGGGLLGLTIDGTLAGPAATGLRIGDGEEYRLVCAIRNFTGATATALVVDNSIWWTEKMKAWVRLLNNTTNVVLQVSTSHADDSFGYNDLDLHIYAFANQNGIVIQNGPNLYNSRLAVRGNFKAAASNTGVFLTLTGQGGSENNFARISSSHVEVQVETDDSTVYHQTINFASASNTIQSCHGSLRFLGTWVQSNLQTYVPGTVNTSQAIFKFAGELDGDASLSPVGGSGTNAPCLQVIDSLIFSVAPLASGGGCSSGRADYWTRTLTQNVSIPLIDSSTYTGPQRKVFILTQAASGGPYTAAFAAVGGTIYWPGGTAPTMPTAASAVLTVVFDTPDGVNWYGRYASTAAVATPAGAAYFTPADPTSTVSTTLVAMGLGATYQYTPTSTGQVQGQLTGNCQTATAAALVTGQGRYGTVAGPATTVAVGSNGGVIANIATWSSPSAGVLDVASTTGYATSGTVWVANSTGVAQVAYTGVAAGQLTGCTLVQQSGANTGTVSTGGAVTGYPQNGAPAAGVGTQIGPQVAVKGGAAGSPVPALILLGTNGGAGPLVLPANTKSWLDWMLQTGSGSDAAEILQNQLYVREVA